MNKTFATLLAMVSTLSLSADDSPKVFAHYMTCFSATPEFYQREIELAQRFGIEGFALNCGEWKKPLPDGTIKDTIYVQNADRIYQAAQENGEAFKLFFSPDFAGKAIRDYPDLNVVDMVERYHDHPNQFRYENKLFLSGYAGRPDQFISPMEVLEAAGHEVTLVPMPGTGKPHPMTWSYERILNLLSPDSPLDGLFRFTSDATISEIIDLNALTRRVALNQDKLYMAGVCPAYNSPNLRDFAGMQGYCAMWEGLIRDDADFVEIVTWNDYNEDSNLMPYRWRSGSHIKATDKRYFNRDESFLDITAYYANWYKTGVQPEITQDKIYFTYRNRSRDMTKVWNEKDEKWDDIRFTRYPYDQIHDDVRDLIYVTAFLTEPAEIEISQGDQIDRFTLGAGVVHAEAPIRPGYTPQVRLLRQEQELIHVSGRKEIVAEATKRNSVQAYHLANRTWTHGAVVSEPRHVYEFAATTLQPGVKPLIIEASQLGDSLYNFRLSYRNDGASEARLTLYADGAPGSSGNFPAYFPLTLPPTAGQTRTISFLWSTWDANTRFTIRSDQSEDAKLQLADFNDFGAATLQKLELLPVEISSPSPAPEFKHPELIEIAGGSFMLGNEQGNPDERPVHQVEISPFAIGKYEVTNEEFERYLPEHHQLRDSYSWRNREPVIYVSWHQAAGYCNYLSRQNGLRPAYDENTWELIEAAEGFRLPTEAEWEFVASGRGENRIYPWGDELPTSKHGNFQLSASLNMSPRRPSSSSGGVQVVGDYPAGASRDGVMDMAGNASEWCTDTYRDYTADPTSDPIGTLPSPHRAIRGGSWGYYNHSQRNTDREFNNPGYGGYIYIGFRIALSAQGLKKLSN